MELCLVGAQLKDRIVAIFDRAVVFIVLGVMVIRQAGSKRAEERRMVGFFQFVHLGLKTLKLGFCCFDFIFVRSLALVSHNRSGLHGYVISFFFHAAHP